MHVSIFEKRHVCENPLIEAVHDIQFIWLNFFSVKINFFSMKQQSGRASISRLCAKCEISALSVAVVFSKA